MSSRLKQQFTQLIRTGIAIGVVTAASFAQSVPNGNPFDGQLHVSSSTFDNGALMPISTINNIIVNNKNSCSIDGAQGGNKSPELSWIGAPPSTQTFVVTLFDTTASFTHWGMYNISGNLTSLPEDAGVLHSKYGSQIVNDFGVAAEYDGPCPPANFPPDLHRYVFTVYALDIQLSLPISTNFPPNAETLYQALIKAGQHGHILATAALNGVYTTTPSH